MIVVTGASGLVGSNLCRALLAHNQNVRACVHHDTRGIAGLELERVAVNLTDPSSLDTAFRNADVVYHLAASISLRMNNWAEIERTNITGTRNVIQACERNKVSRLVYFSSIHALQTYTKNQPVDESNPLVESSEYPPYDRSKAAAELLVRQAHERGMDTIILNPTGIIGPYDFKPSFTGQALIRMAEGRLPGLVSGGFDWVDVRDVVQAATTAARKAPSGSRYLLSGHWVSIREMAREVGRVTRRPLPWLTVPLWLAEPFAGLMSLLANFQGKEPLYTQVSLQALKSNPDMRHMKASLELGYAPRPFFETISDTLLWFRQNGYIRRAKRPARGFFS